MTALRLRDLDADRLAVERDIYGLSLAALAVAVPALLAMEGECGRCGFGAYPIAYCKHCDGTGSNPARRALDTVIGGEG